MNEVVALSSDPTPVLPHRDPFLWVHRLMTRNPDGTEGTVETDVREDWELFRGHFPNRPVFPGVLQVEASAQACLWVHWGLTPKPDAEVLFASVDSYKFKRPVLPGAVLKFHVHQEGVRGPLQKWSVRTTVADQVVGEGSLWLKMQ